VPKEPTNSQRSRPDALESPDDDIDAEAWRNARAQVAELKAVVGNEEFTSIHAEELASRWRVSVRTVWRRVQSFRRETGVRAFLQRPGSSVPGVGRLNETVESIIVAGEFSNLTIPVNLPRVPETLCRARLSSNLT
jgi:hypothetical protein